MKTCLSAAVFASLMWIARGETPRGGHGLAYLPKNLPAPSAQSISDEELLARQKAEKFGGLAPKDSVGPGYELEKLSEFIHFLDEGTLVPRGAILFVPPRLNANVTSSLKGKFVDWATFSAKYRGNVQAFEVTIEQAAGHKPLDAARLEGAKRNGMILVAVLNRCPISVASPPSTSQP